MKIASVVQFLFPLPPPETRRRWWFVPGFKTMKNLDVERDGDYLCYLAALTTQAIGWGYLALLLIDLTGHFGWFLDYEILAVKKLQFVVTWMNTMSKIAPVLVLLFYLRLRLTIDLQNDRIPFLANKDLFRGRKRYEWIENSAFILAVMLLILSVSSLYGEGGLIGMYHLENSLPTAIVEQIALAFLLPSAVAISISMAVALEKAIRFFPDLQEDIER